MKSRVATVASCVNDGGRLHLYPSLYVNTVLIRASFNNLSLEWDISRWLAMKKLLWLELDESEALFARRFPGF